MSSCGPIFHPWPNLASTTLGTCVVRRHPMHGRGVLLLCGAVIRSTQSLPACAARSYGEPSRHAMPAPFAGGDLEEPGVMEAALNARAPSKELVFLSVGDTRDHRRMNKDPALRTISMDFLLNLLANLQVRASVGAGLGLGCS